MVWHFLTTAFGWFNLGNFGTLQARLTQEQARMKALEVTDQLRLGDWMRLSQQFTPLLRWILLPKVLEQAWKLVRTGAGSPRDIIGDPKVSTNWLTTVRVPLQFSRARLVLNLQMLPSGGLIGLNFAPYKATDFGFEWQNPTYVDAGNIREQDFDLIDQGNAVGATLTLPGPTNKYPFVVLVSGSGPCDRDSTVGPNKPFKDIAVGLASQGIASLRFDKATYADKKRFQKFKNITLKEEYLDHTIAAIRYCAQHPELHSNQVFLLGHSLGAWVTPAIATSEPVVKGIVLMAAPSNPYYHNAIRQLRYFSRFDESSEDVLLEKIDELEKQAKVADSSELSMATPVGDLPLGLGPAYWLSCRSFDPINETKRSDKPALVLQGGRDYQATVEDDFSKWQCALHDDVTKELKVYDQLNHLFMKGEGRPDPLEYEQPGHLEERVIADISTWIKSNAEDL